MRIGWGSNWTLRLWGSDWDKTFSSPCSCDLIFRFIFFETTPKNLVFLAGRISNFGTYCHISAALWDGLQNYDGSCPYFLGCFSSTAADSRWQAMRVFLFHVSSDRLWGCRCSASTHLGFHFCRCRTLIEAHCTLVWVPWIWGELGGDANQSLLWSWADFPYK